MQNWYASFYCIHTSYSCTRMISTHYFHFSLYFLRTSRYIASIYSNPTFCHCQNGAEKRTYFAKYNTLSKECCLSVITYPTSRKPTHTFVSIVMLCFWFFCHSILKQIIFCVNWIVNNVNWAGMTFSSCWALAPLDFSAQADNSIDSFELLISYF